VPDAPAFLDRRGFLLHLLTAAGALGAAGASPFGGADVGDAAAQESAPAPAYQHLLTLARELEIDPALAAGLLGEGAAAELASDEGASEAGARALAAELFGEAGRRTLLAAVRDALARQITSDFEDGRTRIAAGWLLSNAEIRLLAIACGSGPIGSC